MLRVGVRVRRAGAWPAEESVSTAVADADVAWVSGEVGDCMRGEIGGDGGPNLAKAAGEDGQYVQSY